MEEQSQGGRRLPSIGLALRQHWVAALVTLVLALVVGAGYAATIERSYTSSSTVLLNPLSSSPLNTDAANGSGTQLTVALETEAQVVSSPAVARAVSDRLDRLVPEDDEGLDVQVPTGTQMVRIAFTTDTPTKAQESAQAFAEEFLNYRQDRAEQGQEETLESLNSRLDSTEIALREALAEAADNGQGSFASREVGLLTDRLAELNTRVSATESLATNPGRVLNPAEEPTGPNQLSTWQILLAAALVGAVGAVALAWYREWRTDYVRAQEDVEIGGVPVFSHVHLGRGQENVNQALAGDEAFRKLRIGVVANARRPHVLAVAGLRGSQQSLAVAAALSVRLAEARYRVAVISADPDDRSIEEFFGVTDHQGGLSDLLTSEATPNLDELGAERDGVTVIPRGSDLRSGRDLLAGENFRDLLAHLRGTFDYILLGSAGVGTADGDTVIAAADSLVLVVAQDRTTHEEMSGALESLEHLQVQTLGAVTISRPRRSRRVSG